MKELVFGGLIIFEREGLLGVWIRIWNYFRI